MKLLLRRVQFDPDVTIGQLYVNGMEFCWICEDTVRPEGVKVHGQTAIPCGIYDTVITYSNRFKCLMPLLKDVPMFSGIRIHPGNKAVDTEGCLLPGFERLPKGVGQSRAAYRPLYNLIAAELERGKKVTTEVEI